MPLNAPLKTAYEYTSNCVMAVCRRTRVLKLVVLLGLSLGLLYHLFPVQVHNFLEKFAPPNHDGYDSESQVSNDHFFMFVAFRDKWPSRTES